MHFPLLWLPALLTVWFHFLCLSPLIPVFSALLMSYTFILSSHSCLLVKAPLKQRPADLCASLSLCQPTSVVSLSFIFFSSDLLTFLILIFTVAICCILFLICISKKLLFGFSHHFCVMYFFCWDSLLVLGFFDTVLVQSLFFPTLFLQLFSGLLPQQQPMWKSSPFLGSESQGRMRGNCILWVALVHICQDYSISH